MRPARRRRRAYPADRDADAEAWIFVGGGLLFSVADRLGGLLGPGRTSRAIAEQRQPLAYRHRADPPLKRWIVPGCGSGDDPCEASCHGGRRSGEPWLCGPATRSCGCGGRLLRWRALALWPGVRPVQVDLHCRGHVPNSQVARSSDLLYRCFTRSRRRSSASSPYGVARALRRRFTATQCRMTESPPPPAATTSAPARLGDRLRSLRLAAGLTQTELAGDRFSKEYVSQIERGKTRPTAGDDRVARRSGSASTPAFLGSGVSTDERGRVEATLARAEALAQAHRYDEAIDAFDEAREADRRDGLGRARRSRALPASRGRGCRQATSATAIELLNDGARRSPKGRSFSDVDRADVVFRLGVCRYKLSSIATATALLDEALALAERSGLPCDLLRADILGWRSRCRRRQRDFEAAREDVERALELAQAWRTARRWRTPTSRPRSSPSAWATGCSRGTTRSRRRRCTRSSRTSGTWASCSRTSAGSTSARQPEQAIEHLKASFAVALEVDSQDDAAQAMGGLATVHLHLGDLDAGRGARASRPRLLEGREDYLHEIGQSQLVLGRSLLERGRLDEAEEWFRAADAELRAALLGQPSRRRLGRSGRPRRSPRRRTPRRRASTEMQPKRCRTSGSKTKERRRQ